MIRTADENSDGSIDQTEFIHILKKLQHDEGFSADELAKQKEIKVMLIGVVGGFVV